MFAWYRYIVDWGIFDNKARSDSGIREVAKSIKMLDFGLVRTGYLLELK